MKILFVHQNFPAQFMKIAPEMVHRGHEVLAVTEFSNKHKTSINTLRYKHQPQQIDADKVRQGRNFTLSSDRGVIVAKACHHLRQTQGYVPDIIVGHSGWGEVLFLKAVWPEAKLVSYSEFYYSGDKMDIGFDPEFSPKGFDQWLISQARAAHMAQSLVHADVGLSPTEWQASTHPPILRQMIRVIHDGIDTRVACPDPNARLKLPNGKEVRAGDEVLTFINRNLEPYRGYHVFMRSLPKIMKERPNVQVVLIGSDGVSYGPPPTEGGSWKDKFLDEVRDQIDLDRVHFMGKVPYGTFIKAMQVSRAHAYLTYPFVLSWSMLEAMSAGCLVVGSRTPPIEEVITDGVNGIMVDFFDLEGWSNTLIEALAHPENYTSIKEAARRTVVEKYDMQNVCLPQMVAFLEGLVPKSG